MADKASDPGWGRTTSDDARTEARHLAEEALQARRKGNNEEAEFVLQQARELDKDAVEDALKHQQA